MVQDIRGNLSPCAIAAGTSSNEDTNALPDISHLSNLICPGEDEDILLSMQIIPCSHEIANNEQAEEGF